MNMALIIGAAACGLALAIYGLYLEFQVAQNPNYKPACDISDTISCSKAINSPYNALLGISNTYFGILFYVAILACVFLGYNALIVWITRGGIIATAYLAYLCYFKVKTICPICTAIYLLNIALFIASHS